MWTVLIQGEKSRPMPAANVIALIEAGKLTGTDLAWRTGLTDWVPLHDCPAFQPHFSTGKMTIIPTAVSPRVSQIQPVLSHTPTDETVRLDNENPNNSQTVNTFQVRIFCVWVAWTLSFLGFIYFWLLYEPTVETGFLGLGGKVINIHAMSIKSNGMMGCSVLLILCSLCLMTFHLLLAILRMEKSLKLKKTAGV